MGNLLYNLNRRLNKQISTSPQTNISTIVDTPIKKIYKTDDTINKYNDIIKITISQNNSLFNINPHVRILEFSDEYNQSVDNIPIHIKELLFGNNFNQTINILPQSIIILKIGCKFDQSLDNLPNSISYLELYYNFNRSVLNLPNSLTTLLFIGYFNIPTRNLPISIANLNLQLRTNKFSYDFLLTINDLFLCSDCFDKYVLHAITSYFKLWLKSVKITDSYINKICSHKHCNNTSSYIPCMSAHNYKNIRCLIRDE